MQNNKNTCAVLYSIVYGGCCTVKSPRRPLLIVRPTFSARAKRRATGNFNRTVLYQVPSPVYIVRGLMMMMMTNFLVYSKGPSIEQKLGYEHGAIEAAVPAAIEYSTQFSSVYLRSIA